MDSFGHTDARLLMTFAASLLVLVAAGSAVASRDAVVELATITDAVDSDLPAHLDLLSVSASLVGNHSLRWEIRTRGPLLLEGTPAMAHLAYRVFVDLDEPFITGPDFAAADRDLSAELQVTSQLQYITNSLAHGFEIKGDTLWLTSFLPASLREARRVGIVVDAVDWDSGAVDQTLAVTLQLPQLDLAQSPGQQACINVLNRGGGRVAAAQGRENVACIKGAARGRVGNPAACLRADARGTVARAAARTSLHERRRCGCDTPPRFGVANHAAIARAAQATSVALVEDIFGADLAGAIIPCAADPHGCTCQRAVSRDLEPIAAAKLRAFRLCAKTALKNGATDLGALERCVTDAVTPAAIATRAGDQIARKLARLGADIRKRCTHNVFAGMCASTPPAGLATCIDQRVNCRVCQMINAMDNLDVSCDLADDALANGSCTPTHVAPGLASLGSLVVLGDADAAGPFRVGPFFVDLLQGDLQARYGPLAFHNQAVGGTTTAVLPQQIASLPAQLPGPVAVVVSANGDFRAAHVECCGGLPQDAARALARNIRAVLSDLLRPGRFGPGVDVHVFWTNVVPPAEIAACPNLALWNAVIEETVAAFDQTVVDAFRHFRGHGCNTDASWFEGLIDCVHHNPTGHDQMERLLYLAIVGAPRTEPTN